MQIAKHEQFNDIVLLIKQARGQAIKAVNKELINLYWNVGAYISTQVRNAVWGDKTVNELAQYIHQNEPQLKGFNSRGLYRMKQFYETYSTAQIVSSPMTQLQIADNKTTLFVSSPMTQIQTVDIRQSAMAKISWTHQTPRSTKRGKSTQVNSN